MRSTRRQKRKCMPPMPCHTVHTVAHFTYFWARNQCEKLLSMMSTKNMELVSAHYCDTRSHCAPPLHRRLWWILFCFVLFHSSFILNWNTIVLIFLFCVLWFLSSLHFAMKKKIIFHKTLSYHTFGRVCERRLYLKMPFIMPLFCFQFFAVHWMLFACLYILTIIIVNCYLFWLKVSILCKKKTTKYCIFIILIINSIVNQFHFFAHLQNPI